MSANIQWVPVNNSLTMSHRMASGYQYFIRRRYNGTVLLTSEGNDANPPRRQECPSMRDAFQLADQWESGVD